MNAPFTTTLNEIKKHHPCEGGWRKILTTLGKTKADDEPLSLLTILDSNGLDDAMWCFQVFSGHDRDFRLFAVWIARQVQHLMTDERSFNALAVAEKFANGECDAAARAAARVAAVDAAWSVECAAARYADACGVAVAAARADAWDAAGATSRSAARAAALAGAGADTQAKQETRLRQMIEDGGWIGTTQPNK